MNDRLQRALDAIDAANSEDPQTWVAGGEAGPKALVYGHKMSECLHRLVGEPSEVLQLAARGQHIRRWRISRDRYPATREGYLAWRSELYRFHAEQMSELLLSVAYDAPTIDAVARIVSKRGLHRDGDVQRIEDVACLVFLEHEFGTFAAGHAREKLIAIVRKTWSKMSAEGRAAALTIPLPAELAEIVAEAVQA
ncbi:MAG: DUF4202 domain-containing protein [Methylotetracoccus sp.]